MPRRIKHQHLKMLEEQRRYFEENLQREIVSANPKKEERIEETKVETESNISAPPPKRNRNLRRFFKWAEF